MIIDSHCHAGKGEGLTGPWDTAAPLDKYLIRADQAGITHTVLFAAFHSDYAIANREVARIVSSHPERFFGFAFVNSVHDRGRVHKLVRQAVEEFGFVGIKLHRYDAPISREICEAARAFSLPVLYDVMSAVSVCELLAAEYPDVNFIIPHLGSFADDWKAQVALIDHLVRHPNIYTDTAGVRRFDILEQAVQRAGPRKILFGSDGPWLHPGVEFAKSVRWGCRKPTRTWFSPTIFSGWSGEPATKPLRSTSVSLKSPLSCAGSRFKRRKEATRGSNDVRERSVRNLEADHRFRNRADITRALELVRNIKLNRLNSVCPAGPAFRRRASWRNRRERSYQRRRKAA